MLDLLKIKPLKLDCRYLDEGDIEMARVWLEGWKLVPIEKGMYPDKGLVLFNKEDKQPIYIGFIWTSNSEMFMIGFVTRNPFYKVKLPKGVRKEFLLELIRYGEQLGYNYVATWAENQNLVNDFKEIGLRETSNKCSELIAKLK